MSLRLKLKLFAMVNYYFVLNPTFKLKMVWFNFFIKIIVILKFTIK